jgi:hypothetical protein
MIDLKTIKTRKADAEKRFDQVQKKVNNNNLQIKQFQVANVELEAELFRLAGEFRVLETMEIEEEELLNPKKKVEEKKEEVKEEVKVEIVPDNK